MAWPISPCAAVPFPLDFGDQNFPDTANLQDFGPAEMAILGAA